MTVDLTGVAVAVTGGVFSILGLVVSAWVTAHIKNRDAAAVVCNAVQNSLGAIQQAATSEIQSLHPRIPGVPAVLAPGVQYVLNHAGDEASRLGLTPTALASKIEAQIGLKAIETNVAVSGNATATVVPPLAPVPVA